MKQVSTTILRATIILIGGVVLAICVFGLPAGIRAEMAGDFDYGPVFVGLYVPALPFFYALYQAVQLLNYIDKNKAFSQLSVRAIKVIKYCALSIAGLFAAGLPYLFYLAERDDAPGVAAIGCIIIGASIVVATFAAVLQKLVQSAVDLQAENDLTV